MASLIYLPQVSQSAEPHSLHSTCSGTPLSQKGASLPPLWGCALWACPE